MSWRSNTNLVCNEIRLMQLPAHIVLGASGAQYLGFIGAAIAIHYTPSGLPQTSSWIDPMLLLRMPIFDTSPAFVSHIREGKAVSHAGLDDHQVNIDLPSFRAVLALGQSKTGGQHTRFVAARTLQLDPCEVLTRRLSAIISRCLAFMVLPLASLCAKAFFTAGRLVGLFLLFCPEQKDHRG